MKKLSSYWDTMAMETSTSSGHAWKCRQQRGTHGSFHLRWWWGDNSKDIPIYCHQIK
jgi:hypothetical protein